MRKHRHTVRRRGMTTVEFALVLPFIFVMAMGMIEVGTMFYSWMSIQKAAQTGARFASTGEGDEEGTRMTQIVQVTEDWMTSLTNGNKIVIVKSWSTTDAAGDGTVGDAGGPCQLVEVGVEYDYHPFTPIISTMLPPTIALTGHDRKLNEPWKPCDDQ